MLIPRKDEGLRVFLQLTQEDLQMLDESKKQSATKRLQNNEAFKLLDIVQSQAQKVLRPYKFEITKVPWISRYTVSQRIVNRFRDQRGSVFLPAILITLPLLFLPLPSYSFLILFRHNCRLSFLFLI